MVLHDNKWDKRAKTRYLKKHNLLPAKVEEGPKPKWTGNYSSDEEQEQHDSDDSQSCKKEQNDESQEPKEELQGADGAKQGDSIVEFEYEEEQNQEDADIIAKHIAQYKFEAPKPKHIQYTGDQEEFNQIGDAIAHGKLTRNIKQRFGKASYTLPDEDEDDFWEATRSDKQTTVVKPAPKPVVKVDTEQQDFLDKLLR